MIQDKAGEQADALDEFRRKLEADMVDELDASAKADAQRVDPELVKAFGGEFNKDGQLRKTDTLEMVHVGGAHFQVIERKTGEELMPKKTRGDEAVRFMMQWHAQNDETAKAEPEPPREPEDD